MKQPYRDILSLTEREPLWYDEVGVPRYCEFHPVQCNDVYADEAALVLLKCQDCGREFKCAVTRSKWIMYNEAKISDQEQITLKDILVNHHTSGYGDPPCWPSKFSQCAGSTMSPDEIKVLEYWHKDSSTGFNWVRDSSVEIILEDEEPE